MAGIGRIGRAAAAILGLYCLAGALAIAWLAWHHRPMEPGALTLLGGGFVVAACGAAALLPARRRQRLFRATRPIWARALAACATGAVACIAVALVALVVERHGIAVVGTDREIWLGYGVLPALSAIAVGVFPLGLGYLGLDHGGGGRPAPRTGRAARGQAPRETPVTYHARSGGTRDLSAYRPGAFAAMEAPVTYFARADGRAAARPDDACRTQAQHAATGTDFIGKLQGRSGGARPGTSGRRAARPRATLSERAAPLVVIAILVLGALSFRLSPTLQSAALDVWLDRHFWAGCAAAMALLVLPAAGRTLRRQPPMGGHGAARSALTIVLWLPAASLGSVALGGYDALPAAWTLLTDHPAETRRYIVGRVGDGPRDRGCVTLHYARDPGRTAITCGLDADWAGTLAPGDVLAVTGEASALAHRFEAVALDGTAPLPVAGSALAALAPGSDPERRGRDLPPAPARATVAP